jgi:hypothetical protein
MLHDPDDDNETLKKPEIDDILLDFNSQENEGFQSCILHHSRLQSLLGVWLHASQLSLSPDDDLVMDELRQALKLLLSDQTHDRYLKTVSVFRAADYAPEEKK